MTDAYMLAKTQGGLADIQTLDPPFLWPTNAFMEYQELAQNDDGTTRALGFASDLWRWGYITLEQYNYLKTTIAGGATSVTVYIKTYTAAGWKTYTGVMILPPPPYQIEDDKILDFTLKFDYLVEVV